MGIQNRLETPNSTRSKGPDKAEVTKPDKKQLTRVPDSKVSQAVPAEPGDERVRTTIPTNKIVVGVWTIEIVYFWFKPLNEFS